VLVLQTQRPLKRGLFVLAPPILLGLRRAAAEMSRRVERIAVRLLPEHGRLMVDALIDAEFDLAVALDLNSSNVKNRSVKIFRALLKRDCPEG
jgi:hypothetical protein